MNFRFGGPKAGTLMILVEGEYVDPLIAPSDNAMNGVSLLSDCVVLK